MPVRGATGEGMWRADSVQIAIDGGSPLNAGGRVNNYYELGVSLLPSHEVATHAWDGNFDWSSAKVEGSLEKDGYTVKIAIPWASLGLSPRTEGFGVNLVVNHTGADGTRHVVEWAPGTAKVKNRAVFVRAVPVRHDGAFAGILSLNQSRYESREEIKGRLVEYAKERVAPSKRRFSVRASHGAVSWSSDWLEAGGLEKGASRITNISVPAEILEGDGEYRIVAESEGGKSLAEASFLREDVEAQIQQDLAKAEEQNSKIRELWQARPERQADAYLQLGFELVDHFLERLKAPGSTQSADWRLLQIRETGGVLAALEHRINEAKRALEVGPPKEQPVTIEGGLLLQKNADGHTLPAYFYGYGHFSTAAKDLPLLAKLGCRLIQQGDGPKALTEDGQLSDEAKSILGTLQSATQSGMKVDYLLSPHYFPETAFEKFPDLRLKKPVGVIKFNIDHPAARKIISDWIAAIGPALAAQPALLSFCLTNEPTYSESGRDSYSKDAWARYLASKHGSIAELNALYGTSYGSFDDVVAPETTAPQSQGAQRALYDWIRFNQQHFADWHRWMNDCVKRAAPSVPTHAKIMTDIFDREMLARGIDPELICDITDLAGNDSYAWPKEFQKYAYNWRQEEMWYDLLHSFRGQPVFNSENHLILDGTPAVAIPPEHSRCVLWQSGLHHLAASATWVWEEPVVPDLEGSIFLRPLNIFGSGEAMLDLTRLSAEVGRISEAKAEVALLYSVPSIYWDPNYPEVMASAYTALTFMGHAVTFISETQLAQGTRSPANDQIRVIVLPGSRHVPDATVEALSRFVKKGGMVLAVGDDNLKYDEYDRARKLDNALSSIPTLAWQKNKDELLAEQMRGVAGAQLAEKPLLLDENGKPVWGIEYRVVPEGDGYLVSMTNFLREPKHLSLALPGTATDLISEREADLKNISLDSMESVLLRVKSAPAERTATP